MKVVCSGVAQVAHAETRVIYAIDASDVDWQDPEGDERKMGAEWHYRGIVEHDELGTLSWNLWEYPEGVQNHSATEIGSHNLITDLTYSLEYTEE